MIRVPGWAAQVIAARQNGHKFYFIGVNGDLVVGSALEHFVDERNVFLVHFGEYGDGFNYPTAIVNVIEYS